MTKTATREEILSVIEDARRYADRLFEQTNDAGRTGRDLSPVGSTIAMLGEHARRGLRALRILADHRMDDQSAPVARGLVDAAIAVEYIRRPTVRAIRKNREVALTVEKKLELFWSYKAIAEQRSREHDEKDRPKSAGYLGAVALRVELGLMKQGGEPSSYWAGVNPRRMYLELKAALAVEGRPDAMDSSRRLFGELSFYAHPNPNDFAFFIIEQRPDGGASLLLRDNHENSAVYGAGVSAALLTLGRWAEQLGEDPNQTVGPLAIRLHGEE
ncbi:MAG: hypothetical protein AAB011_10680 [Candidatus Eisenbacteria bacterium]